MDKPAVPENEKTRLRELRELQILDTDKEECFDRITRLAQYIFSVPIALISLIDEQRQWFKSSAGLEVTETARDISFCGHAILDREPLIVSDTFTDARFVDNPLVVNNPHIRFYAGCPITLNSGSRIGTLCIIDKNPRVFTEQDKLALIDLAAIVEREIAVMQFATSDELTQIPNRRGFMMFAEQYLDLCSRQQLNAKLVFIDLDSFKPVNDQFGHAAGDKLLITLASVISAHCRKSDLYARMGGDEFVILFTGLSTQACEKIIARLKQALSAYCKSQKYDFNIGFSHGIADFSPQYPVSIEQLLSSADNKMYSHKEAKKVNR
ncbi:diguanylate cyclase domain-containing protein [Pseudoalteromonas mariniglutinosa]|uniref:GGDEF domain-containing protein n=1 Tax=Pseudoalteromonas mariniglutinosa TaxID=206042 RepID=UPI00384B712C